MFKPTTKFLVKIETLNRNLVCEKEFMTEEEADAFGEQYLYLDNREIKESHIVTVFEVTISLINTELLHPIG
jgi:hypothetical protein